MFYELFVMPAIMNVETYTFELQLRVNAIRKQLVAIHRPHKMSIDESSSRENKTALI